MDFELGLNEASALLGLPPNVLVVLARLGVVEVKPTLRKVLYRRNDIEALKQRIAEGARRIHLAKLENE